MNQLSSLESAAFSLIERFIARQSIVLSAMRDLRPDIIMPLENQGDPKMWSELRIEYSRRPQVGFWGEKGEWEYFLHGGGCRLTHRQTGERIEWDAGELNKFNVDWFVAYLQWFAKQHGDNEDIKTIYSVLQDVELSKEYSLEQVLDQHLIWREKLLPILHLLCEKGLLSRNDQGTHYVLTT